MDPNALTAVFAGLAALMTAAGGLAATRARAAGVTRREFRRLERAYLAALGHMFRVEQELAAAGRPVPPRPPGLDFDGDDQTDSPAHPPAGHHAP